MELYDTLRTTFAARRFTDDEVPDEVLHRILDHARFAPSGGNRQGWKVIVVREPATKKQLGELCLPALRIAAAQTEAGEVYWQTVTPTSVDIEAAAVDEDLPIFVKMFKYLDQVPVVLVVAVDLGVVASMDQHLDRIGVVSGGSVYPMVWNILLGARNEGFGGSLTTLIASAEPEVQEMLGLQPHEAVAALVPIGKPVKQLTKLSRKPVEEFVFRERADGEPFTG
ncbi:MAG: nitroreductase family protein [Actinomycetia bacterium]|nr:nitroreductase family protein [Actinomycetes bacterium]MCP3909957.1 nitroreductase family protein [Actinomycetes bacterium]MCP4085534.1 nitroreductase family protein [Actinomycetes bacterium]